MRKKKKNKIMKFLIITLLILVILIVILKLLNKGTPKTKDTPSNIMINLVNKKLDSLDNIKKEYNLNVEITYKYSNEIAKNKIISQSISKGEKLNKNDTLKLTVSKGKIDEEALKNDKIDELGHVPIMMYHGIKDMKSSETDHTGGNVDKDGYTRTSEAFRADLELYYTKGYRMIRLIDYVNGDIATDYGKSPIILTFDDGNANNLKVTGLDSNGNIIIDKNSAVGILEEFKAKYSDYNVTATFFVNGGLFNQPEYNEKILNWLVDNGYDIGNHTNGHINIGKSNSSTVQSNIATVYQKLDEIIKDKYVNIIALPFGSPTNKDNENFKYVINGTYNDYIYETIAALRVGWEPEVSPYDKKFDKTYMKRCRAYDNNGSEFDIEMVFNILEKNKYISDGDKDTIVTTKTNQNNIIDTTKEIIYY